MATWKERGVVPDSDDEDDSDSSSIASEPLRNNEIRNDELDENSGLRISNDVKEDPLRDGTVQDASALMGNAQSAGNSPKLGNDEDVGSLLSLIDVERFSRSSPIPLEVFEGSPPILDDRFGDSFVDAANLLDQSPGLVQPSRSNQNGDEVSKSYVQITSKTFSPLSTPPKSQRIFPSSTQSTIPMGRSPMKARITTAEEEIPLEMLETEAPRRNLRHRNIRQLHPYTVDFEEHKRDFRARGIAPTRIAESQEQNRPSSSQDVEFQAVESQENGGIETEESQPMDFIMKDLPSSPIPAVDNESDAPNQQLLSSDEEFPDIDKLPRNFPPKQLHTKPRKTYSKKFQRPLLSTGPQTRPKETKSAGDSIFDIPDSPPPTSPPFSSNVFRNPLSRATSSSSRAPTPSSLIFDRHIPRTADLLTPVTSAAKPPPIFIDSESDSGESQQSENNNSASESSSSSDESIQMRRVGKKIRGVLPASHVRLDLFSRKTVLPAARQGSLSESPVKGRRGIALPQPPRKTHTSSTSINTRLDFLEELSDDEEETNHGLSEVDDDDRSLEENMFAQSRAGFAEEDDTVDAMLPTRKRSNKISASRARKRMRTATASKHTGPKRQPKITEHLSRKQSSKSSRKANRPPKSASRTTRKSKTHRPRQASISAIPRLSILDVIHVESRQELPRFIRIAARTARKQNGQGRHSPTNKFIRLANREDTFDAQSVLQDWRQGRIRSDDQETRRIVSRPPLAHIINAQQTRLPSPVSKSRGQTRTAGLSRVPRRLVVTRKAQTSMNDFVQPEIHQNQQISTTRTVHQPVRPQARRYNAPVARPAQLESTEDAYSRHYPTTSFRTSKKVLDTLYRHNRKLVNLNSNLQLNRFLADDDVRKSTEVVREEDFQQDATIPNEANRIHQRKKRTPHRIDANAAMYRQPSDPLILESSVPGCRNIEADGRKLLGLGKYGVKYPLGFDIFPLLPGVFFHQSTFIGSGQLSDLIKGSNSVHSSDTPASVSLKLGSKDFCWEQWDEGVSSEIGVSFDWIVDNITAIQPSGSPVPSAYDVVEFVSSYVQLVSKRSDLSMLSSFLSRMAEVLREFLPRLDSLPSQTESSQQPFFVGILKKCVILTFQLLILCRNVPAEASLSFKFEELLQEAARICIRFLLSSGLDSVRKVYDDLQYLSFRDHGIQSDQYIFDAWVVTIKILQAARIARGSFWDVANSELITTELKETEDARVIEKSWYTLFSLLPLCEFDEFGVLIPGARKDASFENWMLPQQMLKRIFELYRSNVRQSPGFNDYCRTIVSRCHYLMAEWGWWKCSGIIGTLFDFFALHNLSNLRNEEVHSSPKFLTELHTQPSLALEPEDRGFHIFLKIVALGIKHFVEVNDTKSVRNLVARLLPNHDRHYPKEESILERDLASLRNHHDLLCTLFYAAPAQQRPPISLLQKLVAIDLSHSEACLINIRAWEYLALFLVNTPCNLDTLLPFTLWQRSFFTILWREYLDIQAAQQQLAQQHGGNTMELSKVDQLALQAFETRDTNYTIHNVAEALKSIVRVGNATTQTRFVHQYRVITDLRNLVSVLEDPKCVGTKYAFEIINRYIQLIRKEIAALDAEHIPSDEYNDGVNVEMVVEIGTDLDKVIAPPMACLLAHLIEGNVVLLETTMVQFIECYANLAYFLVENEFRKFHEFIEGSPLTSRRWLFENSAESCTKDLLWTRFLIEMINEAGSHLFMRDRGLDIVHEWMLLLAIPSWSRAFEEVRHLTSLLSNERFFLTPQPGMVGQDLVRAHGPAEDHLKYALYCMRILVRTKTDTDNLASLISAVDAPRGNTPASRVDVHRRNEYAITIHALQDRIKYFLCNTAIGSTQHKKYLKFAQDVIGHIQAYAKNITQVRPFFLTSGQYYWPPIHDPAQFRSNLRSYCVELGDKYSTIREPLLHFLLGAIRRSHLECTVENFQNTIREAMKDWNFAEYVVRDVAPVLLDYESPYLAGEFISIIAHPFIDILTVQSKDAPAAFRLLLGFLDHVIQYFSANQIKFGDIYEEKFVEMLSIILELWITITPALFAYAERIGERATMEEYLAAYAAISSRLRAQLSNPELTALAPMRAPRPAVRSHLHDDLLAVLQKGTEAFHKVSEQERALGRQARSQGRTCFVPIKKPLAQVLAMDYTIASLLPRQGVASRSAMLGDFVE